MKPHPSSQNDEQDQEIIKLLQELGSFPSTYPAELLKVRRAAFLAQIDRLKKVEAEERLDVGDEEIVRLLGNLNSVTAEYPADWLAAKRSAFLQQIEGAQTVTGFDKLRASIQRIFQYKIRIPTVPLVDMRRTSLIVAGLIAAALIGSLLFRNTEQVFKPLPLQGIVEPTRTNTHTAATVICRPEDQAPPCPPRELAASQDLADQANGVARPAISSDEGFHKAAYVNDGRGGASWVSNSADSWIKIDLGHVTTIDSVSLQKGSVGSSDGNDLGQFVIAVALSDVYADGNSSNDYTEYAQVFNSEQLGFNGMVRNAETIRTLFPPIKARFVKMTFKKAGVAIEKVGVFMVPPPVPAEQPTRSPQQDEPGASWTPTLTNTPGSFDTMTSVPTDTRLPTDTPNPLATDTQLPTDTPLPPPTDTRLPSDTPIPSPTNTLRPASTATPVPTNPLSLDTPTLLPTVAPPTAIVSPVQPSLVSTAALIISGNDQILSFTCNDAAVEIRGHANTITLLGSCRSISVTGNGNSVFWQSGAPVITNKGNANIISQR